MNSKKQKQNNPHWLQKIQDLPEKEKKRLSGKIIIVLMIFIVAGWLISFIHSFSKISAADFSNNSLQRIADQAKQSINEFKEQLQKNPSEQAAVDSQATIDKLAQRVVESLDKNGWQTDQNEQLKVELSYPVAWQKYTLENGLSLASPLATTSANSLAANLKISANANPQNLTLSQWLKQALTENSKINYLAKTENVTIAGQPAIKATIIRNPRQTFSEYSIFLQNQNRVYEITALNETAINSLNETLEQIISSLKFY